jgi:VWFA-related protein
MGFGKRIGFGGWMMVGVLAGVGAWAQPQGSSTASTQTQSIPDAPKPQTLPQLSPLTPVGPAVPKPQTTVPATTVPGEQPVPTTLQSTTPAAPAEMPDTQDDNLPPLEHNPGAKIVVPVNFVEVPFTVKDSKGQLVPGLTWRDVRIFENGQRQTLRLFTVDPYPLSVALVIDQTLNYDTMEAVNNSLGALQGAFTPYDTVGVFTYNSSVHQQTQPTDQSTDGFLAAQSLRLGVILDRSKAKGNEPVMGLDGPLAQGIVKNNENLDPNTSGTRNAGIAIGGGGNPEKEFHPLNDAILAAAESLAHQPRGRRRVVYVISDGKEYGSTAKEKEVIRYCQTNKISIYATLVGNSAVPGLGFLDRIHLPLTMRDNALPRFTGATGGQIDAELRQGGIEKSFAKITEEVRTQYTAGYYSHEPVLDGKFRKVEVQVMRPNLTVIAKEGYYPTASDNVNRTPAAAPSSNK